LQTFHAVVKPLGESRPGWKVLRVLGNVLGLEGFDQESVEQVRGEALAGLADRPQDRLDNQCAETVVIDPVPGGFERVADVPIYATDSIVRRASSLQHTADAAAPVACLPTALWDRLGLALGDQVRLTQDSGSVVLPAAVDDTLAPTVVRVPAGQAASGDLGPIFGPLTIEKA
jgi:NADH-quinone oxidoreductase subunit G